MNKKRLRKLRKYLEMKKNSSTKQSFQGPFFLLRIFKYVFRKRKKKFPFFSACQFNKLYIQERESTNNRSLRVELQMIRC